MKQFILLSASTFIIFISSAQHTVPGDPVTGSTLNSTQWLQDITFLQKEILRLHPDPFYKNKDLNKEKFDSLFAGLRNNLSVWDEDKIVTEITRIIGLMNDGHSSIDQFASANSFYSFKFFPLFLYYFQEGLHVIGAPESFKYLIGKKLVAIDGININEVINRMRPLISKDYGNETSLKDGLRFFVTISQYLHGLNVIKNPLEAVYTFSDAAGNKTDAKLTAGSMNDLFAAFDRSGNEGKPLYRQDPQKFYWFRYLDSLQTLYIKYNFEIVDTSLRPAAFCAKMQAIIDAGNCQKVIIDLRQNQGGNIATLRPIYEFLTQPKINQYGKLYILIDRRTQSAATVLAIRLSMISKAIIIGEPAVTAINFFDNDRKFGLPNSKLKIGISTHFQQAGLPNDERTAFNADIPMEITAKDYFAMKDPVLDYVLQYRPVSPTFPAGIEADKNIEGLYQYSALQVLQIRKETTGWKMFIEDGKNINFLYTSLYPLSAGSFQTDIRDLKVIYKNDQISLQTKWGEMKLKRLPPEYLSPSQLIQAGETGKAIMELKRLFNSIVSKMELKDLEANINTLGYQLSAKNDLQNAIKIFRLNTELFPVSYNVWDSLGEAYALAGNKEDAINCYSKALELEPGLISATEGLKKLQ